MLSSIFHFGQISKFKKGVTPRKKWKQNFCGYAHLHIMSFISTKFQEILLSSFRGVALTRKTGLTDGSKTLYPPQLVAWGIMIHIWIGLLQETAFLCECLVFLNMSIQSSVIFWCWNGENTYSSLVSNTPSNSNAVILDTW